MPSSGAGEVRIQADAVDRSSTLAAFAYTVDSSDEWQTVLPSDKIADGPEEKLDFSINGLEGRPAPGDRPRDRRPRQPDDADDPRHGRFAGRGRGRS